MSARIEDRPDGKHYLVNEVEVSWDEFRRHLREDLWIRVTEVEPPRHRGDLSFGDLHDTNIRRLRDAWPAEDPWAPWDWSNAIAGEVGEACVEGLALFSALAAKVGSVCNLTKKMNRVWPAGQFPVVWNTPEDQRLDNLARRARVELADVVIYADLLATKLGGHLGDAIREKFNAKSEEIGSAIKMPPPPLPLRSIMSTMSTKSVIDAIIAHDGHYDGDPRVVLIVEFENSTGRTVWGVTWEVETKEMQRRYLIESKYIHAPRILWEAK